MLEARSALFLDRDGVINVDHGFVYRLEDFVWQPGIFDLARAAAGRGFLLVVATNQSGIGRGMYGEQDFQILTAHMRDRFAEEGAPLAAVYHCPFHHDAARPEYRVADHPWRKPRPGMVLAARDDLDLDLSSSILMGDRISDIVAGATSGIGTLVLIGHKVAPWHFMNLNLTHVANVGDAARWMAEGATLSRSR